MYVLCCATGLMTDGLLLTSLHGKSLVKDSVLESILLQNILIIYFVA